MKLAKKVMLSLIAILSVAICSVIAFAGSNYKESVVESTTSSSASNSEVNIDEVTSNEEPSTITYAPDTISVQKGGSTLNYAYSPSVNAKDSTSTIAYEYIFGNTMNRATAVNLKSIDTTGVNVSYAYSATKLDTSSEITGETDYTLQKLENKGSKVYIYVIVSPTDETIPTTFTTSIVWYYGIPTEIKIENNINNDVVTQTIVSGQKIDSDTLKDPTAPEGYYFDAWFLDEDFSQLVESEVRAGQKVYARYHNFPLNSSGMTYSNGSYSVAGDIGLDNLIVPTIYDGKNGKAKVTSIADECFNAGVLFSVDLPCTIITIGSNAFLDCGLESVNLQSCVNLTTIGESAFRDAYVSNFDFSKCINLTTIEEDALTADYVSYININLSNTKISNLDFMSNVFGIEDILVDLSISNCLNLTSIPDRMFQSANLKTIDLSGCSNLTSIGEYAFHFCDYIHSIDLSNCTNLTIIGDHAFQLCYSLASITFGENSQLTTIGTYAFAGCNSLTSITIPSSVVTIEFGAFEETCIANIDLSKCTNLRNISGAFYFCEYIHSIDLSNCTSLTTIGDSAFSTCTSLTSITIPSSVTKIGSNAFEECWSLNLITFEDASGWYYTSSSDYTGGTQIDVTNASTNATYFKSTYLNYYWYKQ